MKLLFDENLSPQLVQLLQDLFPNSIHVRDVGLKTANDPVVWKHAQDNDLIIVRRTRTCISSVLFSDIPRRLFGYDWAIVLLRTSNIACEDTSVRLKHSQQMNTHPFWRFRSADSTRASLGIAKARMKDQGS